MKSSGNEGEEDGEDEKGEISTYLKSEMVFWTIGSVIYQRSKAYVSAGGDRRQREEDFAKFVKSQDKEMKEFVSEREKLVKTYEDERKNGFEKIQQEEREQMRGPKEQCGQHKLQ